MVYSGNFHEIEVYSVSRYVIKHPVTNSLDTKSFLSFLLSFFFLSLSPLPFFRTVKFRGSRSTRIGPNKQLSRRPSLVSWWIFHVEYVPSCLIRYESLMFQLFFSFYLAFLLFGGSIVPYYNQIAIIRTEIFLMHRYCSWIMRKV